MDVLPGRRISADSTHWVLVFLLFLAVNSRAQHFEFESAGVRFGIPAADSGTGFREADVFVNWSLPWSWDLGKEWRLDTRLELSAGWLGKNDDNNNSNGGIFAAGPVLALGRGHFPVRLEAGEDATILTQTKFGLKSEPDSKDFGIPFQFTTHIGVYWDVLRRVRVGYRFQHMSNADLGSPNPGLTLHVFYASYRF